MNSTLIVHFWVFKEADRARSVARVEIVERQQERLPSKETRLYFYLMIKLTRVCLFQSHFPSSVGLVSLFI